MIRTRSATDYRYRIVSLESLKRIFEQHKNPAAYTYQGHCGRCGCHVSVKIEETSGGYGLLGGILYESDPENYFVLCVRCSEKVKASGGHSIFS